MTKYPWMLSALAAVIAGLSTVAYAESDASTHTNGELVVKRCTAAIAYFDRKEKADMYDVGWCLGFVKGIGNGYLYGVSTNSEKGKQQYCPPKDLTVGQEVRSIVDYLQKNSQQQQGNSSGSALALLALIKAYPCNVADSQNMGSSTVPQNGAPMGPQAEPQIAPHAEPSTVPPADPNVHAPAPQPQQVPSQTAPAPQSEEPPASLNSSNNGHAAIQSAPGNAMPPSSGSMPQPGTMPSANSTAPAGSSMPPATTMPSDGSRG